MRLWIYFSWHWFFNAFSPPLFSPFYYFYFFIWKLISYFILKLFNFAKFFTLSFILLFDPGVSSFC